MRGKRAKQYRKLMHQYGLTFGFREPYQVLVDAEMVSDAARFKMDLAGGLTRTLQGQVKPMITQCSMRHLYATKDQTVIVAAQAFERRRCNHHTLEEPLSTLECIMSVVDPKGSSTNKHRYCVASQDTKVRAALRQIPGVPLVYINRSVMIMEPMAGATEDVRNREEKAKFRAGLKGRGAERGVTAAEPAKRKREDEEMADAGNSDSEAEGAASVTQEGQTQEPKKKKRKGPKGPNPLSVKRPKKTAAAGVPKKGGGELPKKENAVSGASTEQPAADGASSEPAKRKRKRKPKQQGDGESAAAPAEMQADA
ncbi:hypothetical protein K490DRAFT_64935 [Saccharata proteae CBS 121410]|uniref:U three protein 23 n=1 Tax=Saccharata proteae CBS 121410 TaxID=1314787 RepID=A0A9P4M0V2_9PEZI|nr:hypothetical protein K490DRAFT_64935 [Saccharata proteae CBS 121410]